VSAHYAPWSRGRFPAMPCHPEGGSRPCPVIPRAVPGRRPRDPQSQRRRRRIPRRPARRSLRHGIDCSRVAWSRDGAWVACSGFTPRAAVLSMDGLPGDDRVRDLSLDGRELRSYPGEVHHLRLLPDGGFATCGPARPGARERVVRAWHPEARGRRSPPVGSPAQACDSTSRVFARWTSTRGCASWRTAGRTACIGSPSGRPVARTPSSDALPLRGSRRWPSTRPGSTWPGRPAERAFGSGTWGAPRRRRHSIS
jgi:hypothetical protein